MKFCKDCKHFTGSNFCVAPQNGISPIDGKPAVRFASANREPKSLPLETATIKDFGCGPDAHYFEQKQIPPKPWWKIWS